jgi:drug/metabolite transporter (DMT)-like permease
LTLALVHGFSPVDTLALEWGTALSMASLIAIACLLRGLKDIGAVNASILLAVEPITAGVLGHFVLDQSLDVLQIAGGVLIILGVIILIRSKAAEKGAEPAMA